MTNSQSQDRTRSGCQNPIWEQALDWLMRVHASPNDPILCAKRDQWLAQDPAHAKAYRKAERVWDLAGQTPILAVQPLPFSRKPAPAPRHRPQRRLVVGGILAASIAAFLASPLSLSLRSDYATGVGEIRTIVLDDGSRVTLDVQSAIDVEQNQTIRHVSLRAGQAFFQVAHNSDRPFIVERGPARVTVTGTAFAVGSQDDGLEVEVESGSVTVTLDPQARGLAPSQARTAHLVAGDRAQGASHTDQWAVDHVPVSQVGAWRQGRLVVDGQTVRDVVSTLRGYYRGVIILTDDALANRTVSGVFDLTNPEHALRTLAQVHGGDLQNPLPAVLVLTSHHRSK